MGQSTAVSKPADVVSLPVGGRSDRHPVERSMTSRWAAVVRENPAGPAFGAPGEAEISYAEADRRSDRLARNLLAAAPEGDGPVGMVVDLSVDGLVTLVGVLKTGRPVVPLDPHLPPARLEVIAEIAGLSCCLVGEGHETVARSLPLDDDHLLRTADLLADEPADTTGELPQRSGPDPAIVVFTSGSTGRPKGVALTHDLLLDGADSATERLGGSAEDRFLLALPLSFAAGAMVFSNAVMCGAGVWAYDPRDRGISGLTQFVREKHLTNFYGTPHLLRSTVKALAPGQDLADVRVIVTAGEALFGRDVEAVRPHLRPGSVIANWMGSSEAGALTSFLVRDGDPVPAGALPGGIPDATKQVRLLRPDGTEAATGEAGELVITSHYLSGGYWNDPVRTAEKFSTEPDGRRTYRMGDLGRFDEHGNLQLLGRMDGGVKVRGYLVELSEVEGALLADPTLEEACVVAVTSKDVTQLVAYVSPAPDQRAESSASIRRRLRTRLPDYMIPRAIVQLPKLPRTERGKVDRQALPPVPDRVAGDAPTSTADKLLADVWSRVLGVDDVGLSDDFWELGADSLSVEEMLSIAQAQFSVRLTAGDLVDAPTLREFSDRVHRSAVALPTHPTALTLRAEGSRTPLFCFAGAGGLATAFISLARHTTDRPVYAFQAHGIAQRAFPDWSVERAAARHLQMIRVLQPSGPYLLAGHSLGGLIALEIARLLQESGEEVALVTVLDTYLPASTGTAASWVGDGEVTVSSSVQVQPAQVPAPRFGGAALVTKAQELRGRARNVPLKLLAPFAGVVRFQGLRHYTAFFEQGMLLAKRHRLRPYSGRVLVVLTESNPDDPTSWAEHLTGQFDHRVVGSDHNSVLREPYVGVVADLLAEQFEDVGV